MFFSPKSHLNEDKDNVGFLLCVPIEPDPGLGTQGCLTLGSNHEGEVLFGSCRHQVTPTPCATWVTLKIR